MELVKDSVGVVGDEVHLLKAEHRAEDQIKFLIDITEKLEHRFLVTNLIIIINY